MRNRLVIVTLIVVLLGVIVTVPSCGMEKEARLSQAQELYDFAMEARHIWQALNSVELEMYAILADFRLQRYDSLTDARLSDVYSEIRKVEDNLKWLYAPPDARGTKSSLLRQIDLDKDCAGRLSRANIARKGGDELAMNELTNEADNILNNEVSPLYWENEQKIINLQLQAERDLK